MANWKNEKPTVKQLEYIQFIENQYGIKFTGTTKGEASNFIDKAYKQFRLDLENINWDVESRFG